MVFLHTNLDGRVRELSVHGRVVSKNDTGNTIIALHFPLKYVMDKYSKTLAFVPNDENGWKIARHFNRADNFLFAASNALVVCRTYDYPVVLASVPKQCPQVGCQVHGHAFAQCNAIEDDDTEEEWVSSVYARETRQMLWLHFG